ncbi:3',5'-cyclic-nucleotide phosphodiesterase [Pollutibacter soli]|uniref:3',5'-cyclic-nucleotide phosphodiesterase n=1 Tax=Pollutibacter soli TaxID=3034157 RepID=UPI0030133993
MKKSTQWFRHFIAQSCRFSFLFLLSFPVLSVALYAQNSKPVFTVIPLGVKGGGDESNLSSYLVAPAGDSNFICLDAGTVRAGIQYAIKKGIFKATPDYVLQNSIRAYFISHPHLDHLAGLVINSPDDNSKPIYGLSFCLSTLADKYFSWKSWANFTDRGESPQLKKYTLQEMTIGDFYKIDKTSMQVAAFPLSHSTPQESTAFLVKHDDGYLLYLGDTGADSIEKSTRLSDLWKTVGPLVASKQLKAVFIEVSFSNDQKTEQLFGHLTPDLLMKELTRLADFSGGNAFLKHLPVVITHQKPGGDRERKIKAELHRANTSGVRLIFPEQASPIQL